MKAPKITVTLTGTVTVKSVTKASRLPGYRLASRWRCFLGQTGERLFQEPFDLSRGLGFAGVREAEVTRRLLRDSGAVPRGFGVWHVTTKRLFNVRKGWTIAHHRCDLRQRAQVPHTPIRRANRAIKLRKIQLYCPPIPVRSATLKKKPSTAMSQSGGSPGKR